LLEAENAAGNDAEEPSWVIFPPPEGLAAHEGAAKVEWGLIDFENRGFGSQPDCIHLSALSCGGLGLTVADRSTFVPCGHGSHSFDRRFSAPKAPLQRIGMYSRSSYSVTRVVYLSHSILLFARNFSKR